MSDLYWLFVMSGFKLTPGEVMDKSPGERMMMKVFLEKAISDKQVPVRMVNMLKKK